MSTRRASPVRPRYGRIAAAASSTTITLVAVLGGTGALPSAAETADRGSIDLVAEAPRSQQVPGTEVQSAPSPVRATSLPTTPAASDASARAASTELPARSGEGRRVVFSEGRQRVWLVDASGEVRRTYPVSGSIYDNLDPGSYEVYSRSQQAWGIDDSGTMRWFVRFAHGDNAAIGFHDIPVSDGEPVQTRRQLGTPLSHGCIRQRSADARALWDFAPLGTTVVVTA